MAFEKTPNLLTEGETADHLKVTIRCLRDWRTNLRGPAWIQVGRRIRYRMQDVDSWLMSQRQDTHGLSREVVE